MPVKSIRCPDCGRRASASEAVCPGCRSSLFQLCECGATSHLACAECSECGAELQAPVYQRRPVFLRVVAVIVLLALTGGIGAAYWNARQRKERKAEIWRLSDAAFAAVKEGRYDEALPLLERYLAERPRDAQMHYLLAVTQHQLEDGPMAGAEAARRTLEIDRSFSEAASFLATAHEAAGEIDVALEFARRAAAGSRPSPADQRRIAQLELRRPEPDLDAAIAALELARAGDPDEPRVTVLLALLKVRQLGLTRVDTLPTGILGLVTKADEIVLSADPELAADPLIRLAEIEIALLHGRVAPARLLAQRLVAGGDTSPEMALRARVLLGRAALLGGDVETARAEFAAALASSPTRATAVEAIRAFSAAGALDVAVELLTVAVTHADADPRVQVLLSAAQAAGGDVDAAVTRLQSLRSDRPEDVALLVQLGDLLSAQGRLVSADDAYASAESAAAATDRVPTLRRAMLSVAACSSVADRRAAAAKAVEHLDALWGDPADWSDSEALDARGRLGVLAGGVDEAKALLVRALALAPSDASVRVSLAEAELASGGADSLARASELLIEASDLAPFHEPSVVRISQLFIAMGNPRQADALCQTFLKRVGDRPAVLEVSADALRRMGLWGDAADRLSRLRAASDAVSPELLRWTVDSLLRAGDEASARELVAAEDPDGLRARLPTLLALHGATPEERIERLRTAGPSLELAFAYVARGERGLALDTLRAAVATDGTDTAARRVLVLLLLDDSVDVPQKIDEARELASATPGDAAPGLRELLVGAVRLAEGDLSAAQVALEAAVAARPEDPFANLLYGRVLFENGHQEESLPPLRRSIVLPGALPSFAPVVSRCVHAVARSREAGRGRERLLWEALLHDSSNVDATVDLVNLLFESGREQESAALTRRLLATAAVPRELAHGLRRLAVAAALRGTGFGGLVSQVDEFPFDDVASADQLLDGLLMMRAGRDLEALRLMDDVRSRHPENPIAVTGTVEAMVRLGSTADARRLAATSDGRVAGSMRFRLAFLAALERAGRSRDVLDESEALRDAEPTHEDLVELRARAHLALDDSDGAVAEIRRAERAATGSRAGRFAILRAAVLREHGSPEDALRLIRELSAGASDDPDLGARLLLAEAEALLRLARYDEVVALVPRLEFEPGRDGAVLAARAAFVRGTLAMAEGRTADAIQLLRLSLRLNPAEPAAANNLAWLLSTRPSRAQEGLGLARGVTAQSPRNPEFWDTRAACARTAGHGDEAEESWQTALTLLGPEPPAPDPPERLRVAVWLSLAELYADQGRFAEAVRLARRVIESAPAPETRRRARAIVRLD